jgi:hypothetical protein
MKRRVASNPARVTKKKASKNSMTNADKKAFVARMAKARKNPTKKSKKRTSKSNPAVATKRRCNPRKRRNPEVLSMLKSPKTLGINVLTALLSAVGTRQIPQMLLKDQNAGWKGYLANVATGLAFTLGASEFVSVGAAQAALLGSGVIVLDRVLMEKFSPVGKYLSLAGIGDSTAATSLGTVADGFYIHPTIRDANGRPIIPHEFTDAAIDAFNAQQRMLPPAHAMSGAAPKSRFVSRF